MVKLAMYQVFSLVLDEEIYNKLLGFELVAVLALGNLRQFFSPIQIDAFVQSALCNSVFSQVANFHFASMYYFLLCKCVGSTQQFHFTLRQGSGHI